MTSLVSTELFREFFSQVAAAATVVAVVGADGSPQGLACTAMCPVSAEPPLLLVSLAQTSTTLSSIESTGSFALNLMSLDGEQDLLKMATKAPNKFDGIKWRPSPLTGHPVLEKGLLGFADCRIVKSVAAGDHLLLIAEVLSASTQVGEPLVYYRREFHTVERRLMSVESGVG